MSRPELRHLSSLLSLPLRTRRLLLLSILIGGLTATATILWIITPPTQRATHVPVRPEPALTPQPSAKNGTSNQKSTQPMISSDLTDPTKKDIAMQLVSSAENSSLDWRAQYGYIEDIGDGRGYTGGTVGFTSRTGDMLEVVQHYVATNPAAPLSRYLPALRTVNGSDSHAGLGAQFVAAWKAAASDPAFQAAQDTERDATYFNPAVSQAKADGLHALGQFIYYDALVMHGPGDDAQSFGGIRSAALSHARIPAQGGDETTYLNAFLDARLVAMRTDPSHQETDRVDTEQRVFLNAGNLNLEPPLKWSVYGDSYSIQ